MRIPDAFSYDTQLSFLATKVSEEKLRLEQLGGVAIAWRLQMFLSLAESVKTARDHNLNCRKDPMS